jgi:hypothetical protein
MSVTVRQPTGAIRCAEAFRYDAQYGLVDCGKGSILRAGRRRQAQARARAAHQVGKADECISARSPK